MKTLANCNAVDFLTQTNKIRKAVAKWLTDTDIMNIRKHLPPPPALKEGMEQDEVDKVMAEHKKALEAQSKKNMTDMLDAVLDEHPAETLEILGMICFLEPKEVEKIRGIELFNAGLDALTDPEVLRFFTSLVSVSRTITSMQLTR